jgi:ElaB/YqjD/DUF883 family membrane-anchored ribosome-binding protein
LLLDERRELVESIGDVGIDRIAHRHNRDARRVPGWRRGSGTTRGGRLAVVVVGDRFVAGEAAMASAVARAVLEDASEEVRALAGNAAEAIDNGMHEARRTYRVARRRVEDAADDAAACIRKQPLTAVGVAFGAGIVAGAACGLIAATIRRR